MTETIIDAYLGHVPGSDQKIVVVRTDKNSSGYWHGLAWAWLHIGWEDQRPIAHAVDALIGKPYPPLRKENPATKCRS